MTHTEYTDSKVDLLKKELLFYGAFIFFLLFSILLWLGSEVNNLRDGNANEEQCNDYVMRINGSCTHKDHRLETLEGRYVCKCFRGDEKFPK